jgi:CPA1 family monovalent cation:H+ antiporter
VFLVIGLELPEIVQGLRDKGIPLSTAIGYGVMVTVVLIVARIISSYAAMLATIIFRPSVAPSGDSSSRTRLTMPLLLGWTGMRGVVSLAAALAIPAVMANGADFPFRNLILFITFVVILLTLVVQGLTLPYIIRHGNFFTTFLKEPEEETRQRIKQGLREQNYRFLKDKFDHENDPGLQQLLKMWEAKNDTAGQEWMNEKTKAILIEMLDHQRQYLSELNKDPLIIEELIRAQLYQIDLEEERLKVI